MGSRISKRLLDGGYELVVYDVRREAVKALQKNSSVVVAKSAKEVAARSDIVFVSLPTPEVVQMVALGKQGLYYGHRMKVYVDLSTTGPQVAQRVAHSLNSSGVDVIDAPVSGGVSGAENGTLSIMVSGPRRVFNLCRPILEVISTKVFYIGKKAGQGQMMKLANNLLSATALAATSEAMALGVKSGLDPKIMLDVLNASSGRNSATQDKFPKSILTRRFDYGFTNDLMYKDLKLCTQEAERLGVPIWIGNSVHELWKFVIGRGDGNKDFTTIVKYFEGWAGVEVSSKT